MVVFGQKLFYSGKSDCIRAKLMYSGNSSCVRAKVLLLEEKWLF